MGEYVSTCQQKLSARTFQVKFRGTFQRKFGNNFVQKKGDVEEFLFLECFPFFPGMLGVCLGRNPCCFFGWFSLPFIVPHVWGPSVALRLSLGFSCIAAVSGCPPSPKTALSDMSRVNCQGCRTSSCLSKGVAHQGGVQLASVALHCATMLPFS